MLGQTVILQNHLAKTFCLWGLNDQRKIRRPFYFEAFGILDHTVSKVKKTTKKTEWQTLDENFLAPENKANNPPAKNLGKCKRKKIPNVVARSSFPFFLLLSWTRKNNNTTYKYVFFLFSTFSSVSPDTKTLNHAAILPRFSFSNYIHFTFFSSRVLFFAKNTFVKRVHAKKR